MAHRPDRVLTQLHRSQSIKRESPRIPKMQATGIHQQPEAQLQSMRASLPALQATDSHHAHCGLRWFL